MPNPPRDSRLAYYAELSQVGIEMAAPIGVGAFVDYLLGWAPWLTILGAVLGLVGGLFHLVSLANRPPKETPGDDSP